MQLVQGIYSVLLQPSPPALQPALEGSTLHAVLPFQPSQQQSVPMKYVSSNTVESVSSVKSPNLSQPSFSFTQNKISNANSLTGMYVSLPGVRQLWTLATHKDTGITNSCFWKLHNTKPNTSPLELLPQCATVCGHNSN